MDLRSTLIRFYTEQKIHKTTGDVDLILQRFAGQLYGASGGVYPRAKDMHDIN
jgi:hypothetical protein